MNPIGLHCLHQKDVPEIIRVCDLWQSSVVKFLDGIPELAQVLRGVNHPITGILRLWREGLFHSNDFDPLRQRCTHDGVFDAEEAVRLWLEGLDLEPLRGLPVWLESYNEVGLSLEYLRFEAVRCRVLRQEYGIGACVVNSGVGWTLNWEDFRSAGLLDAIRAYDGLIGSHGYAGLIINLWHGEGQSPDRAMFLEQHRTRKIYPSGMGETWLTFRCDRYHRELEALGYGDLRHVITEFGFDNAGYPLYSQFTDGKSCNSWRSFIPTWEKLGLVGAGKSAEEFVASEYDYANRQYQVYAKAGWFVGACVWTFGSAPDSDWRPFDIKDTAIVPILGGLMAGINPTPPPATCTVKPLGDYCNIRSTPTFPPNDANKVGELRTAVPALARVINTADNRLWYRIGTAQYVSSVAAKLQGDCQLLEEFYPPVVPVPDDDDASNAALLARVLELEHRLEAREQAARELNATIDAAQDEFGE